MAADRTRSAKRVLEPNDRIAEVLFGLIMVLTFTGSLSVAEAGRDDVRAMLIGALGCNIAWGIIDGILYLMGCLSERGSSLLTYQSIRRATDAGEARRLIAASLPGVIAEVLQPAEIESLRERLNRLPHPPERARLTRGDWAGGIAVFLLVFLSTFPVTLPFMFMQEVASAMRVSNAVALVMLAVAGFAYGRHVGHSPGLVALGMVVLGAVLVAMTIALGG